jgi:DNA-binding MarR family transcriptional regulator
MPYLPHPAAEATGLEFLKTDKAKSEMLRTDWHVLFQLGRHGDLTAKAICTRANQHKTKVSRTVSALENLRFWGRTVKKNDRRAKVLSLPKAGKAAFDDLLIAAQRYSETLTSPFAAQENATVRRILLHVVQIK